MISDPIPQTFTIDFETTFGSDHTLKKQSIEEYVRSDLTEIICLGIREYGSQHGLKVQAPFVLTDYDQIGQWLHDHQDCTWIAQAAQFDGFVANEFFQAKPAMWADTLSMARAVYPRLEHHSLDYLAKLFNLGTPKKVPYNEYRNKNRKEVFAVPGLVRAISEGCLHDCLLTERLMDHVRESVPYEEYDLIDSVIRMFTEPCLEGDQEVLKQALDDYLREKQALMDDLGTTEQNLRKDSIFASMLRGLGVEPPMKTSFSKTHPNGRSIYAFAKSDKAFLALREHEDYRVGQLVEGRFMAKTSIIATRAGRLLDISKRGPIPVYLNFYGAHTGRLSGGDKVNLQNVPTRSRIFEAFMPPEGDGLVWADLSQIECRIAAYLSNCEFLLANFEEGKDVYGEFGTIAFDMPVSKTENSYLRHPSKETVLGCTYGMGKERFFNYLWVKSKQLGVEPPTREVSDRLHWTFRSVCPEVPELWKSLDQTIYHMYRNDEYHEDLIGLQIRGKMGWLPNGLRLDWEDLHREPKEDYARWVVNGSNFWGGTFLENWCQALARIIMTDAWRDIKHYALDNDLSWKVVLSIHDELIMCVPKKQMHLAAEMLGRALVVEPTWASGIPLACEVYMNEKCYKEEGKPLVFRSSNQPV